MRPRRARWRTSIRIFLLTACLLGSGPVATAQFPATNPGGLPATGAPPNNPYAQPANPYSLPGGGAAPSTTAPPLPAAPPPTLPAPGFDPYSPQPAPAFPSAPPATPQLFQDFQLPNLLAPLTAPAAPVAVRPVRCVLSGEYLMLRASDAAMTNYAVPVDASTPPPSFPFIPMGAVADVELEQDSGYRVGVDWVWNEYSRWVGTYTSLDLGSRDRVESPGAPLGLQALVLHPSTPDPAIFYDQASATSGLDLQLVDVEYRRVFVEEWYRADLIVGGRYGRLEQDFSATFVDDPGGAATTETVRSTVDFDGAGIRFGARGDWRSMRHGFFIYAQATTNFLAGEFTGNLLQQNNAATVMMTSIEDDRIVNITDVELGLGWHSPSQKYWFSGGYLFSTWNDVVNNAGLIRSLQGVSPGPIHERLTFDGFTVRAEVRF